MGHLYAFRILDDYFDQQEDGATAKEVSGRNFGSTRARVSANYRRLRLEISAYASITPIRTAPPTVRMSQNAVPALMGNVRVLWAILLAGPMITHLAPDFRSTSVRTPLLHAH